MSQARRHLLLLLGICAVLFLMGLGARPLWDIDESRHSVVARGMVESGDWITPRFNGEVFFDKPVLHYWLVAACFKLLGATELAARLPSAVLGTALVLLTYCFGRRAGGARVGLLSGLIMATALETVVLARTVVHDMSLAFFVLLALYCFHSAFSSCGLKRGWYLGLYAASGAAVLAKGPLGVLLPGLAILVFLIIRRRVWATLREAHLVPGIAIFALVAVPWYFMVGSRNPGFTEYFFLKQNFLRFVSDEVRHSQPFYYYLPVLMVVFFPWSPFLLVGGWDWGCRLVRREAVPDAMMLLIIWAGTVLVFFSAAGSKLPTYIFPAFPAMAVATAGLLNRSVDGRGRALSNALIVCFSILLLVSFLTATCVPLIAGGQLEDEAGLDWLALTPPAVVSALVLTVALGFLLRARVGAAIGLVVAQTAMLTVWVLVSILPQMDRYRSSRDLGLYLDSVVPRGERLVFFRRLKESALFYTDRGGIVLNEIPDLYRYLDRSRQGMVVMEEKHLKRLTRKVHIVASFGENLVVTNPDAGSASAPAAR